MPLESYLHVYSISYYHSCWCTLTRRAEPDAREKSGGREETGGEETGGREETRGEKTGARENAVRGREERRLEQERMQMEEEKRQEEEERTQEESDLVSQQMESALALLQPQVDKEQCPPIRKPRT